MYYGFMPDYLYIVLVLPALLLSLICQANIKSTYKKTDRIPNRRGLTGAQAAAEVLLKYGITDVSIQPVSGTLSDNYNPKTKTISLSQKVFSGTSIAAVGIACHEAGHAAQHAENYFPIKVRNFVIPLANIGSSAGILICILGYVLGFGILSDIGILFFSFVVIFQLVTLPVEFNASRRALDIIQENGLLYEDEYPKCKKVLAAAALTYVAAMLVSLANFIRIVLRFSSRKR